MCFGFKLQVKGGLNNLIFLIGFQMCEASSFKWLWTHVKLKGIKIAFTKKLQNISQQLGASPPDSQSLQRLGAPPPYPCLSFVSQFGHFHILTISLNLLPRAKS